MLCFVGFGPETGRATDGKELRGGLQLWRDVGQDPGPLCAVAPVRMVSVVVVVLRRAAWHARVLS